MPRYARQHSESGYLHIITRGVNKQILFEEPKDHIHYLNLLKRFSLETDVTICAYCLMENHVHLLICDKQKNVSLFMKKLGVSYSYYFNAKYHRTGHLFENRFQSRVIEGENYLLTVFRYILNNPRDAGICSAAEYKWSSYGKYGLKGSFVDTSVFQEMLGSFEEYAAYINAKYEDEDPVREISHDDEWAKAVIRDTLGIESGSVLRSYDWARRNEAVRMLKQKGLSVRQIERLTGINRNAIQRA